METLATHLVSLTNPASFAAEQYQNLRLKIERLRQTRDLRVIAITSPGASDGKTVTSINLAGALARGADQRVLLIDADLRRPSIARQMALADARRGLADALMDPALGIADVVQPLDRHNMDVCPAGTVRGGVSQILRSP